MRANGRRHLLDCADTQRYYQVCDELIAQLGGPDNVAAAKLLLIEGSAAMAVMREIRTRKVAAKFWEVSPRQELNFGRNLSTERRALETIGLERKARDITPSLDDYVQQTIDAEAAE